MEQWSKDFQLVSRRSITPTLHYSITPPPFQLQDIGDTVRVYALPQAKKTPER